MENLMKNVPMDVIINHIIPYTYSCQSKELLFDLKNNIQDYSILETVYSFDYNYTILLRDLVSFLNEGSVHSPSIMRMKYILLLKRHIQYKNIKKDFSHFSFSKYLYSKLNDKLIERRVRFLWGLMTPIERTRFINKYVLLEDMMFDVEFYE
jgi:hypothetical protein